MVMEGNLAYPAAATPHQNSPFKGIKKSRRENTAGLKYSDKLILYQHPVTSVNLLLRQ